MTLASPLTPESKFTPFLMERPQARLVCHSKNGRLRSCADDGQVTVSVTAVEGSGTTISGRAH